MKTILCFFLCLLGLHGRAQDEAALSGRMIVQPGSIETYTVTWSHWGDTYEWYSNVSWNVTNGTVVSSDKHSVTVYWGTPSNGYFNMTGMIEVNEDMRGQGTNSSVTVVNNTISSSQYCTGLLGPAAIAIDFGSGATNPGPALPGGTTTYQYYGSCAISPGQYTIVNNTIGCRSHWHDIPKDHTPGSVNGYFLMVDANSNRDEFYRSTVTGLTSALKYEFSAWAGNLSDIGEAPAIRFEIYDLSGNILGTSGTITIPYQSTFDWQKIGFMFTLPAGITSVQVVMVNANAAETGNDVVIDDISFAPCYPPIIASFSSSTITEKAYTCNNGTVNLYASWPSFSPVPFANPGFQWQKSIDGGSTWTDIAGATSMNYTQTESTGGVYNYRMFSYEISNPSLNITSNLITYFVQVMTVDAKTLSVFACAGINATQTVTGSVHLDFSDPDVALTYTYAWSPGTYLGSTNTLSTEVTLPAQPIPDPAAPPPPPINYYYTLSVTNNNYGCAGSAQQTISQYIPRKILVPSAFTPVPYGTTPTGTNNTFYPINITDYPGAEFSVYDRWGQLIFHAINGTTRHDYEWDGTVYSGGFHIDQPSGTYVWQVQNIGCNANIYSASTGDGVPYGTVVLIR